MIGKFWENLDVAVDIYPNPFQRAHIRLTDRGIAYQSIETAWTDTISTIRELPIPAWIKQEIWKWMKPLGIRYWLRHYFDWMRKESIEVSLYYPESDPASLFVEEPDNGDVDFRIEVCL